MTEPGAAQTAPLTWTEDGAPRSRLFGDIYFSTQDGLAETRAVFLDGCGLPEAWAGRRHFTVGELGFGTGLNIAALLHLWRASAPAEARLHIFSIEAYPLTVEDARRALAAWPELAKETAALLEVWPSAARGFQRLDLPAWRATLDLAVMEVEPALRAWSGKADAWFLDGFAPAANPQMWSEAVLGLIAARSAPGARAATFTVAGHVRRGLQAAGFSIEKKPGHGRKRERLEARLPEAPAEPAAPPTVAIVGAGIAAASLARAFAAQGAKPIVIAGQAPMASGNPAALVTPGLDAGGGEAARLQAQAFARAVTLYRAEPDAVIAQGVTRRPRSERDPARFAKVAAQSMFAPGSLEAGPGGLEIKDGLVIEPAAITSSWLGPGPLGAEVLALDRVEHGCRLRFADGRPDLTADVVILAAGWGTAALTALPLSPIRGQVSFAQAEVRPAPQAGGAYVAPTRSGFLFGATHDRGVTDAEVRSEDHPRNLAALAELNPELAATVDVTRLEGRAGVRATTPDRMPIVGEIAPGLFVLTGLGARGFSTAPLLAEHVCAQVLGLGSPLPDDLAALIAPGRFAP